MDINAANSRYFMALNKDAMERYNRLVEPTVKLTESNNRDVIPKNEEQKKKTIFKDIQIKEKSVILNKQLYNHICVIINDKLENGSFKVTQLEEQIIKRFLNNQIKNTIDREQKFEVAKYTSQQQCYYGAKCISWKCIFKHPPERRKECTCNNKACKNLHKHEAICTSASHPPNCSMAHSVEELKKKKHI